MGFNLHHRLIWKQCLKDIEHAQRKFFISTHGTESNIWQYWREWNLIERDNSLRWSFITRETPEVKKLMETEYSKEFTHIIFSLIHDMCNTTFNNKMDFKEWRRVSREIQEIKRNLIEDRWIRTKDDKPVYEMSKGKKYQQNKLAITMLNWFHWIWYVRLISISNFPHHVRTREWLRYIEDMISENFELIPPNDERASRKLIYMLFTDDTRHTYIGETKRSVDQRCFSEHLRTVVLPKSKRDGEQKYDTLRTIGAHKMIYVPLFSIPDESNEVLKRWETHLINTFQPTLNYPFIMRQTSDAIIRENKHHRTSVGAIGRFRSHAPFSTISRKLPQKRALYGLTIDDMVSRLSSGRSRYERVVRRIRQISLDDRRRLVTAVLQRLEGRSRVIAMHRLRELDVTRDIFTILKVPFLHSLPAEPAFPCFNLKQKILRWIKRFARGPLIIQVKFINSPTVSQTVTNQSKWNKKLHTPFPCTCGQLEKFSIDRPAGEHVCLKFSELKINHIVPKKMSVKSRTIPSADTMERTLRDSLEKFFKRNQNKLMTSPANFLKKIPSWTDEIRRILISYAIEGFPMESELRGLKKVLDNIAVISRAVDKLLTDLTVTCPQHYQQRCAKMFIENDAYTILTGKEFEKLTKELFKELSEIHVEGTAKLNFDKHQYGYVSIWHKKSGLRTKDRPLVSYLMHAGKERFSVATKAGLFLLSTLATTIGVMSTQQVVDKFGHFNTGIFADQATGVVGSVHVFSNKLDIDNFFGNIIHSILFDAWDWIWQKWTTSTHARKRYIAIPKYKGRHFMQFCERVEEWRSRQTHPHTYGLRRIFKEAMTPRYVTSYDSSPGFLVIAIEDIGRLIKLDIRTAIGRYGDIPLLQNRGSPQGSPLSVLNASLVAAYMEERSNATLVNAIQQICNTRYCRFLRQRWVDDINTDFVTDTPLDEEQKRRLREAIERCYHPFQLKDEDASIFVGIRKGVVTSPEGYVTLDFCMASRSIQEQIDSNIPKFAHGKSNITREQVTAIMKGSIIRCLDTASSVENCTQTIYETLGEFVQLGHSGIQFSNALYVLSRRYAILEPAYERVHNFCQLWIR